MQVGEKNVNKDVKNKDISLVKRGKKKIAYFGLRWILFATMRFSSQVTDQDKTTKA